MKRGGGISGAVSLVMIFCVLCLSVFAVLTLATAERERRLTDLAAGRAADYYAADAEATKIVAALVRGETPDSDVPVEIMSMDSPWDLASFSVPAGGDQMLRVELRLREDGTYDILAWKTVYTGEWKIDDHLEVWGGN